MKKILIVVLAIVVLFCSNTALMAENVVITESQLEEDCYKEINYITYLTVSEPEIFLGDEINILLGIDSTDNMQQCYMSVHNIETDTIYNISGKIVDSRTLIFSDYMNDKGSYSIDKFTYFFNGEYIDIFLNDIGIEAKFGVDTIIEDCKPDAYIIDEDQIVPDDVDIEVVALPCVLG